MKQKEDAVKGLTGGVAYLFKSNKVKKWLFIEIDYEKGKDFLGNWYSWSW
jgi:hypothetical protein